MAMDLHTSLSYRELGAFATQLGRFMQQDASIPDALDVLNTQTAAKRVGYLASNVRSQVTRGRSLRDALANAQPRVPETFAEAVGAAQAAGRLSDVLQSLGSYYGELAELRARIWTAALYPLLVATLAVAVLYFILLSIIPNFQKLYDEMGLELPDTTLFMLHLSGLANNIGTVACGATLLVVVVYACARALKRNVRARFRVEQAVLSVPLIGLVRQSSQIGRLCGMLGILLEAGVPERRAAQLAGRSAGGPIMEAAGAKMCVQLEEGRPMSEALLADRIFPRWLVWMLQVSERRGNLPQGLRRVARSFHRRARLALVGIEAVMPAVFLLTVVPFVGLVVYAMFLPLIRLMGSLGA